ncbi:hypothetical protein MLD38_037906 [Melastoma candidum]|uniref:Uncharacterized protein n=1 Tax=Melastoma candidum TaxID=119954 RepID=A0ACB9KYF0_9MYRT|nr:hypothetical protein MLD38_037906 [Melastoma candidum]
MIWELEMQCLQLYQSKVEEAANIKARLHQSVAAKEAELATLLTSLGEPNNHPRVNSEKRPISLKEELPSVTLVVEDLRGNSLIRNLSLRKLAEYETCLRTLQREKERLVSILDDYKFSRKQKQEEKRRQRKLQDMCLSAMEAKYGSRPSPRKSPSFRKSNGYSVNGNRFLEEMRRLSTAPSNYLAISKEDAKSTYTCICGYEASSPPHI